MSGRAKPSAGIATGSYPQSGTECHVGIATKLESTPDRPKIATPMRGRNGRAILFGILFLMVVTFVLLFVDNIAEWNTHIAEDAIGKTSALHLIFVRNVP